MVTRWVGFGGGCACRVCASQPRDCAAAVAFKVTGAQSGPMLFDSWTMSHGLRASAGNQRLRSSIGDDHTITSAGTGGRRQYHGQLATAPQLLI